MNNQELKELKKEQDERLRLLKSVVKQKNDLAKLESQFNQKEKSELEKQKVNTEIQNEKEKIGLDRARVHTQNVKRLNEWKNKLVDVSKTNYQIEAPPAPDAPAEKVIDVVGIVESFDGSNALKEPEESADGITQYNNNLHYEDNSEIIDLIDEEISLDETEAEFKKKTKSVEKI